MDTNRIVYRRRYRFIVRVQSGTRDVVYANGWFVQRALVQRSWFVVRS